MELSDYQKFIYLREQDGLNFQLALDFIRKDKKLKGLNKNMIDFEMSDLLKEILQKGSM